MIRNRILLGVLISGSGTNLQAIIDACNDQSLNAEVAVVISDHDGARGLVRAKEHGIDGMWVDRGAYQSTREYNIALRNILRDHLCDYVVMAGYMRLLGKEVLDFFPNRVVNLHPALLPSFPGANGIKDAFNYGVKVTGVTVHFANENFDEGPIIMQEPIAIAEEDTVVTLEAKIHEVEHRVLPQALGLIADGRLEIVGRKVKISPQA
ncbi:MAG: phosphoribosylglycinamide formyltransferase [Coriobacteriia bacterium]|nr:phosphoribosylglycinamide formyltransferase [Coriobacteriia bacterium]